MLPEVFFPVPGVHDLSSKRVEYNRNAAEQDAVEETLASHEVSDRLKAEDAPQRQLQRIVAVHFEAEARAIETVAVVGAHQGM